MENFRKLKVWHKAHGLVLGIYKITEKFPKDELFGLVSQMRRAAVSIAANIAEGSKRKTIKDKQHFNCMAETSLEEVKYYLILSYDLKFISVEQGKELMELAREIGRMLNAYTRNIQA